MGDKKPSTGGCNTWYESDHGTMRVAPPHDLTDQAANKVITECCVTDLVMASLEDESGDRSFHDTST